MFLGATYSFCEGRLIDSFVFRLSCLLTTMFWCNTCITAEAAPNHRIVPRFIFPSLMNKTPRYLNSFGPAVFPETIHRFPAENQGLRLGGASHSAANCPTGHRMMKPTEPSQRCSSVVPDPDALLTLTLFIPSHEHHKRDRSRTSNTH